MSDDDERFERDLRETLLARVPPAAPHDLRVRIAAVPDATPAGSSAGRRFRLPRLTRSRPRFQVAAALMAVAVLAAASGAWLVTRPSTGPAASPSAPVSSVVPSPAPSSAPAIGPEVDDFGLIDATHGWATSSGRLFVTADAGRTWTYAPGIDRPGLVTFVDPLHGWTATPTPGATTITIDRTSDGGRTWQSATIESATQYIFGLSFLDADHGVIALASAGPSGTMGATDAQGSTGTLWATSDGGATWTRAAKLPSSIVGQVAFVDQLHGWAFGASRLDSIDGRPAIDELLVTGDGGRTWQVARMPALPADLQAGSDAPPYATFLGTPTWVAPGEALLARIVGNGNRGETDLLLTRDDGRTWTVATTVPTGASWSFAPMTATTWLLAFSTDQPTATGLNVTTDGGRTWRPVAAGGLPDNATFGHLESADSRHLWARVDGSTPGRSDMNIPLQLYASDDGGLTWHLLSPQGGPQPTPTPCSLDSVAIGTTPSASTPWFNLFVDGVSPNAPLTIQFDTPVIGYPGMGAPDGPITVYVGPASPNGGTKLSFRPASPGVDRVTVRLEADGCSTSTVVSLTPLASTSPSTSPSPSGSGGP